MLIQVCKVCINNTIFVSYIVPFYFLFSCKYKTMSSNIYYYYDREYYLQASKDYYKNNKERILKKSKYKYHNMSPPPKKS